jgi:putative acetyltransferase
MSVVRIRDFVPADAPTTMALFRAAVRETAGRDYSEAQRRAWAPDEMDAAEWAARRAQGQTWVAEQSGSPAGFIDLERDGRIGMLFVHPSHQRRGVASALLAHLETAARQRGLRRLHTEASVTARPFFARHGFRTLAPQTVPLRGERLLNYRMEKAGL